LRNKKGREKTEFSPAAKPNTVLISEILNHSILIENRLKKIEQICSCSRETTQPLVNVCYGSFLIG
jgi:hypothetical protein